MNSYVDSPEMLKETQLSPIDAFYSGLDGDHISDDVYAQAQEVWKEFGMKTFEDYHNLYNELVVLQLADVFENFRCVFYKNYGLNPAKI